MSKLTHKPRHNTSLFKLCHPRTESAPAWERDKKKRTNTMFSHLQPARVVQSSPIFARW